MYQTNIFSASQETLEELALRDAQFRVEESREHYLELYALRDTAGVTIFLAAARTAMRDAERQLDRLRRELYAA